jgi:carboxylesterase
MKQIIPTAEPFFFPGSRAGTLLVHGFTGAPKEMRPMGEYLHRERHYTILGLRLSGHVITRDAQRQTVFKAAADFANQISA